MRRTVTAAFLIIAVGCSTSGTTDSSIADAAIADAAIADAAIADAGVPCGPATCQQGCCDTTGRCVFETDRTCGTSGSNCVDCIAEGATCKTSHSCVRYDGGCFAEPVPGAAWETGSCPDAGCPTGSFCLRGIGESGNEFGCVPLPQACDGGPTCACMGCVCAIDCREVGGQPYCDNGTISLRSLKRDVVYVTEADRAELARQTLQIPLARYRYWNEPESSRRRLGFLIDDQPTPSPAVLQDRQHVDEYGYTSMLLATIQAQAKEIAALKARVEKLERQRR